VLKTCLKGVLIVLPTVSHPLQPSHGGNYNPKRNYEGLGPLS